MDAELVRWLSGFIWGAVAGSLGATLVLMLALAADERNNKKPPQDGNSHKCGGGPG